MRTLVSESHANLKRSRAIGPYVGHKNTICENERMHCNYLIIPHTCQRQKLHHPNAV